MQFRKRRALQNETITNPKNKANGNKGGTIFQLIPHLFGVPKVQTASPARTIPGIDAREEAVLQSRIAAPRCGSKYCKGLPSHGP